jgi:dihydroorotase
MELIIKNATFLDTRSSHHLQQKDIAIDKGVIKDISASIHSNAEKVIDGSNCYLMTGLVDIGAVVGEPGYESRETVQSLLNAAVAGGYTTVLPFPNTNPTIDNTGQVEYIKQKAKDHIGNLVPIGAVSMGCKGEDIAELMDMQTSGINLFSDGLQSIQLGGMLLRALLYSKSFDGIILNMPYDKSTFPKGHLHEGVISTVLGLRGIPDIAETIMLQRDLDLLKYTDSQLHVHNISSASSIELIRKAKSNHLKVTASVCIWNLIYSEENLEDFDPNFKLTPPLRSKSDRTALIEAINDGTIDFITSGHTPLDVEQKELEFPYATPGAISLQTAWSLAVAHVSDQIAPELLHYKMSTFPSEFSKINMPSIEVGNVANIVLFNPLVEWTLDKSTSKSLSINSPCWHKKLKGKVEVVINNSKIVYF